MGAPRERAVSAADVVNAAGAAGAAAATMPQDAGVDAAPQVQVGACPLHFDGDNSYPECRCCGDCCRVNVLAMTHEEVARIRAYIAEHGIVPIDRNKERCCLEAPDGRCMVWEARAQVCRLHNCHVPRFEILLRNPSITVPSDLPLVDLHECFIDGDDSDPRYR